MTGYLLDTNMCFYIRQKRPLRSSDNLKNYPSVMLLSPSSPMGNCFTAPSMGRQNAAKPIDGCALSS